jgi:gluconolactonase
LTPNGRHLGTITPPEKPINIGFSDSDMKTLYMASHTSVFKVRIKIPGL